MASSIILMSSAGTTTGYTTIQSAINAAASGETVVIYNGTYTETITIKDGVNMFYLPGVTITSANAGGTITDGVEKASIISSGDPTILNTGGGPLINLTISGSNIDNNSSYTKVSLPFGFDVTGSMNISGSTVITGSLNVSASGGFGGNLNVGGDLGVDGTINGVKKCVMRILQTSTNNPVITVLENTITGFTPALTRSGVGLYYMDVTGTLDVQKTVCSVVGFQGERIPTTNSAFVDSFVSDEEDIIWSLRTALLNGSGGHTDTDNVLTQYKQCFVEITVYP